MSGVSTAAYFARRAAQKERVRILYRRALKDTLNWAVHRHIFYRDASDLREKFNANQDVSHGLLVAQSSVETLLRLLRSRLCTTMVTKTTHKSNFFHTHQ
ncbi:PREDICTED: NADH dehydrogenase [ubiquinone] 1 beta subcomplex subunit 9-like isoform X2 [Brassica oleracea var. oleracea]|uniref:NADH dehydrogenase [ubiquinone] 1 beta subcomplex subunit 9-like isoform X2 n=1 Tax=Brassica oleracea var. oleracea TaxID=109376 RepID=UPI0006A72EF0|nr:PREDICTED: NADH dehydrogenase [ubiquinone] 1 beta subcomplex subunit 9-like isoform X2 [Brassica oleracea var. oleracea]